MTGGAGSDTVFYDDVTQSRAVGLGFDRLVGFDDDADKIQLSGLSVASFAGAVAGSLSAASMSADLEGEITVLGANQALLFTANAGDLAGRSFLLIDANGTAGFQASSDFVIEIVTPASAIDNLGMFV